MNHNLFDPYLDSMNFLNEACIDFPNAISFGSGRPREEFFAVQEVIEGIYQYQSKQSEQETDFLNSFGQYSLTKGIINKDIAKLLENDEGIVVKPEHILITDGAQEAMVIITHALFHNRNDVLLVSEPSYIGFIGYAKILGIEIHTVKRAKNGIDIDDLDTKIIQLKKEHKMPVALYDVPDFHNPTGICMALEERNKLLQLAELHNFYIIEDNPYGYFRFDEKKIPTLKALDRSKRVIYIGSFSKILFPAIRIGFLILDQTIQMDDKEVLLVEQCKKIKSFTSVNTSPLLQAMVGSILIKHNHSLIDFCRNKVDYCKTNRNIMAAAINHTFCQEQKWEQPEGGFFGTLKLPFAVTDEMIREGARDHGIIVCPMSMFCLDKQKYRDVIRLSYSYNSPKEIEAGIERLYYFIKQKIKGESI